MAKDILTQLEGRWTAAWRAGPLEPGYGPYALNAVDSFFSVLDQNVPDERKLSLTALLPRYEHCGRIFRQERKWSDLCLAVSSLCTDAIIGKTPNVLSERLEHFEHKQVRRMTMAGLERLLGEGTQVRYEMPGISVFCKYHPADYNERQMQLLGILETAQEQTSVDECLRELGALTREEDSEHFHPRVLRKLYAQYTAIYRQDHETIESHHDFEPEATRPFNR